MRGIGIIDESAVINNPLIWSGCRSTFVGYDGASRFNFDSQISEEEATPTGRDFPAPYSYFPSPAPAQIPHNATSSIPAPQVPQPAREMLVDDPSIEVCH